jgi:hypothetical protein
LAFRPISVHLDRHNKTEPFPNATEGERQLARRAATLAIACEQVEAQIAAGHGIED